MFNNIALGIGITAFGAFMARAIQKNHEAMVKFMQGLLDKSMDRIGVNEETQIRYQDKLMDVVHYVDLYVNDPKFWRTVGRTILSMSDPVKRTLLLSQFDFNKVEDFLAVNLPPELKATVNEVKQTIAVEAVAAHANIAIAPQFMVNRDVVADVKDAVKIEKIINPEPDVTQEQLEDLLVAHKAMKEEWKNHK